MNAPGVRILNSIEEVERAEWDGLAGHHVVTMHGWLAITEKSSLLPRRQFYLVVEDERGLAGGISCLVEETAHWMSLDRVLFGGLDVGMRALGASTMPALVCGPDIGNGEAVLVRADADREEQRRIAVHLIRAAEELARERGWSLCFRNVPASGSLAAEILRELRFPRTPELPTTHLDLPEGGFREYRLALRRTHPATEKNIAAERSKARRTGLEIRQVEHPGEHRVELHQVMEQHYQRLNQRPFPYGPEFYEEMENRLQGSAWVFGAHLEGELVGTTLILAHRGTAHLPMIGFDPVKGRAASLYFNLCYNAPIEWCAAAGYRHLALGRTTYGAKVRRGCRLVGMDTYVRPHSWMGRRVCSLFFPARARLLERRVAESMGHGQQREG
ncbi:MAG: GNAT family N-acetyltransferase [Bryobacterales bacterium]|nr:GNAT family N-acetyltransferase [Bryobacterales bacterium]